MKAQFLMLAQGLGDASIWTVAGPILIMIGLVVVLATVVGAAAATRSW
jgi:hypothetical protein